MKKTTVIHHRSDFRNLIDSHESHFDSLLQCLGIPEEEHPKIEYVTVVISGAGDIYDAEGNTVHIIA